MKKIYLLIALCFTLLSCNNNKTTDVKATDTAPVGPGPDNVDGNVPDTTSTIQLNKLNAQDSSRITDSIKK